MRIIATTVAFLVAWLTIPVAWAECPEGMRCPTADPAICLSEARLDEHEADLEEARDRAERMHGRLAECRDAVAPLQARIEKLAGEKAVLQVENRQLKATLPPAAWAAFGACGGASAAGIVQMAVGGPAGLLRGGLTVGVGVGMCGLGLALK